MSGPPAVTNQTTASFMFASTPPGCAFECKLDEGAFASCNASHTINSVGIGAHTLTVRASGDTTPATHPWLVDTTKPDTNATCPASSIAVSEVSIPISSTEAMATFTCNLDGAEASCTNPYTKSGLSVGAHVFSVYSTDRAGNKDDTPFTCNFTVTAVSPDTNVTCPPSHVASGTVNISFSSTVNPATFTCQLGDAAAEACTSPKSYTLEDGDYEFTVTAAGDPSGATCEFSVDTALPEIEITSPLPNSPIATTVTYTWSVNDPEADIVCLFENVEVECGENNSYTRMGLMVGDEITFEVRATDAAGNMASDSTTNVVGAGPGVEVKFADTAGNTINGSTVPGSGQVIYNVIGDFPMVKYVCTISFGSNVQVLDPCPMSPISWTGLPHGALVEATITATNTINGQEGPPTTRTATVDAQGPVAIIVLPADDHTGPFVEYSFVASTPFETGPVTWTCERPDGIFTGIDTANPDCAPGGVTFDVLDDGTYTYSVYGTDQYGNRGPTAILTFEVDATGPAIRITRQPGDVEVCPTSDDLTAILFVPHDGIEPPEIPPGSDAPEPNDPVRFFCQIGDPDPEDPEDVFFGPAEPCGVDEEGRFDWGDFGRHPLSDGLHYLLVVAYDDFDNPGPPNDDPIVPDGVGVLVPFIVDRDPPVLGQPGFSISTGIIKPGDCENTDGDNCYVSSGDSDVNLGERHLVRIEIDDIAHPPPVITAASLEGVACDVPDPDEQLPPSGPAKRPQVAGVQCALVAPGDLPDGDDPYVFYFEFSGLTDEDNLQEFSITFEDQCGPVNTVTFPFEWVADTTANTITFNAWDNPFVSGGVDGPAGDYTDNFNSLNFTIYDAESSGSPDELPDTVECDVPDAGPNEPCDQDGDPYDPAVTIDYSESWSNADEGLNTATVHTVDEVGNVADSSISWCVDNTPPVVTLSPTNSPQVGTCEDANGIDMTLASGVISFTVNDPDDPSDECNAAGFSTATCTLRQNDANGAVVSGYNAVDCTDLSFEFGTNSGGAALTDGVYHLTITVTDAVNNASSTATRQFRTDGTPPTITFVSPMDFLADGPATNDLDIFANIKEGSVENGTFSQPADLATAPPTFTYNLNNTGASSPSTATTYPIAALSEVQAGHDVVINGTDCVGNTATNSLHFYIDETPPTVVTAPNCTSASNCTLDHNAHTASITLSMQDVITNIEQMECLLDFAPDTNDPTGRTLVNPDTSGEANVTFVPCSTYGLTGVPTAPAGDTARPRTFTGTVSFTELAAGPHKLWYRGVDFWGHATTPAATVEFTMDYAEEGGREGHVIAIGHDYRDYNQDTINLIGNAVYMTEAANFTRNIRIIALDLGNVDADGNPDADAGVGNPKENVDTAIADRLNDGALEDDCSLEADGCVDIHEWGGNSGAPDEDVTAMLRGHDVLLIYDQNSWDDAQRIGAKTAWLAAIRTFVNNGGIAIVLDGRTAIPVGKQPGLTPVASNTVTILGNAETWNSSDGNPTDEDINLIDAYSYDLFTSFPNIEEDCRNDGPLTNDVGFDDDPTFYYGPVSTVAFDVDVQANDIFSTEFGFFCPKGCETIPIDGLGKRPGKLGGFGYLPVVMDKVFVGSAFKGGLRENRGPARVFAMDYDWFSLDDSSYAIYSHADGSEDQHCRLRSDGTASHDLDNGGTISAASTEFFNVVGKLPGEFNYDGIRHVMTTFNVQLFEWINVGGGFQDNRTRFGVADVSVEVPILEGAFNDLRYYVTNGCMSGWVDNPDGPAVIDLRMDEAVGEECLSGDRMSFMAYVFNNQTGAVLGVSALQDVERSDYQIGGSPDKDCDNYTEVAGTTYWCVDDEEWPEIPASSGVQWFVPNSLDVGYTGTFLSGADHELVSVLLGLPNGYGYDEGLFPDPEQQAFFVPKNPADFFNPLRLHGLIYTYEDNEGGEGPFSLTRVMSDIALPSDGNIGSQTISRQEFLARVASPSFEIDPVRVRWDLNGGSLDKADASFGYVTYRANDCDEGQFQGQWLFYAPPREQGAQMPDIPGELDCWNALELLDEFDFCPTAIQPCVSPNYDCRWRCDPIIGVGYLGVDGVSWNGVDVTEDYVRVNPQDTFYQFFGNAHVNVQSPEDVDEAVMSTYCPEICDASPKNALCFANQAMADFDVNGNSCD